MTWGIWPNEWFFLLALGQLLQRQMDNVCETMACCERTQLDMNFDVAFVTVTTGQAGAGGAGATHREVK